MAFLPQSNEQFMNIKKKLRYAEEILKNAQFTRQGADITQVPFFQADIDTQVNLETLENNSTLEYRNQVEDIANRNNWSLQLKYIYLLVGTADREFTYRGFTFFSLNKILEREQHYQRVQQNYLCDLALQYEGMGWVYVLTLDRESGQYFVRMDGGSNGYDRLNNERFFQAYRPSSRKETLIKEHEIFNGNHHIPMDFSAETNFSKPNQSRVVFAK